VQLYHVLRSDTRELVKVVYVLGDHARRFAGSVKARDSAMTSAGLRIGELIAHGEAPSPRFIALLLAGNEFREWDWLIAAPQASRGTEVWNAAFGGKTRTRKRQNDIRCVEEVAQTLNRRFGILRDHAKPPRLVDGLGAQASEAVT
jgi:hypothetical protein